MRKLNVMMFHVESHLPRLVHSLEKGIPLSGKKKGYFSETFQSCIASVAQSFCKAIDDIEKTYRVVQDAAWIEAGSLILAKLKASSSKKHRRIEAVLKHRLCGLKYRSMKKKERPLTDEDKEKLFQLAKEWKEKQIHFNVRSWQERDQQIILELIKQYPDFARLILQHPDYGPRFYDWTIRDKMSVSSFVEFPKTMDLFHKLRVSPAFSKAGVRLLRVTVQRDTHGQIYKYLSYPIFAKHEGKLCSKHVRVWDKESEFEFPLGFRAKLRDIYTAMRCKHKYWVDFIISERGYENWNVAEWGPTDKRGVARPIKLAKNEWFKNVPVSERITLEEARGRYGKDFTGGNFGVALRAARKKLDLDINRAHSFLELCFPDGKGDYIILNPGKFTRTLPTSFFDLVLMLGNTLEGSVVSHDPNAFYHWRQQTRFSVVVEKKEFLWFAERIRQSIIEYKKGNFVFSALGDSCSTWSQSLMNDLLERKGEERQNFFNMPLVDSEPKGLLGFLVSFIRLLPKCLQGVFLRLIILFLLPWRSKTIYDKEGNPLRVSALTSQSWRNLSFDNPAYLFHRQINERALLPTGDLPEWL